MKAHPLSKVVTNFFWLFVTAKDSRGRDFAALEPALGPLAATLVRTAAHKILVPHCTPLPHCHRIEEEVKRYPPSLRNRIEIVDKNREIFNRVSMYLKPIWDEISNLPCPQRPVRPFCCASDFLYKVFLASKLSAEADVSEARSIAACVEVLRDNVEDEEAQFRLDTLQGINSIYRKGEKIQSLTIIPEVTVPSLYDRISDLLDEAEIVELSRSRYLLGIPDKVKIGAIEIRNWVRKALANEKHNYFIKVATDIIHMAGKYTGVLIPSENAYEILKSIHVSPSRGYNPPMIDLDPFRAKICKSMWPRGYSNFVFPDGVQKGEHTRWHLGLPREKVKRYRRLATRRLAHLS